MQRCGMMPMRLLSTSDQNEVEFDNYRSTFENNLQIPYYIVSYKGFRNDRFKTINIEKT